jgi:hypothetical protein
LAKKGSGYTAALLGCFSKCTESSPLQNLQDIPVVGIDENAGTVFLDLAAVGKDLDMLAITDPEGKYTHLKTSFTKTVAFDYSFSTLVFDVESHMLPVEAKVDAPETVFTTRWFLRLSSAFNPSFESRGATEGVGYFMTERSAAPRIQRWSTTSADGVAPVRYYLKNIPEEYQPAFRSAFDEWNAKLKPILGKDFYRYEFVPAGDPRLPLLVAGDPRFNIVEWDLLNVAPYGGLGPSIANQFTGEILAAHVLIQGPTIVGLYQDWFKVNQEAQALREQGQAKLAELLLAEVRAELLDRLEHHEAAPRFELSMHGLRFKIHSQLPEVSDPVAQRNDFDPLPAQVTYEQYMFGYFHDMLTHELGHNLGLRHNFKGNLGSIGDGEGEVSRSVMEYLGRDYRYRDHVGDYDLMALAYGYRGELPAHKDWFCTDEDGVDGDPVNRSAECTSGDATADPFAWFEMRLATAINYLIARGDTGAPSWSVDNLIRELGIAVKGLGAYASSAEKTAGTWVRFFGVGDRPKDGPGVKGYVIAKLKAQLCDASLEKEAALKATPEARTQALANIQALRAKAQELIATQKTITPEELSCGP